MRLNKPLKDDTKIDIINLAQFYDPTDNFGLGVTLTPDYGFNESTELIAKNN